MAEVEGPVLSTGAAEVPEGAGAASRSLGGTRAVTAAAPQLEVRPVGLDGGPVAVEPGATAVFDVVIKGTGTWVVEVSGLPSDWVTGGRRVVRLTKRRRRVRLRLKIAVPARCTQGGRRVFEVHASAASGGRPAARAQAAVDVAAPTGVELEVSPQVVACRRRFAVIVTNPAPTATSVRLLASAQPRAPRVSFDPEEIQVAAGGVELVRAVARPARRRWIGRTVEHRLSLWAIAASGPRIDGPRLDIVERPLIGRLHALALVVVLAAAAFGLTRATVAERVTVPAVTGMPDMASAERALRAAGLELDPLARRGRGAPGTVTDQIPAPGDRVQAGTAVTLAVGLGPGRTTVPRLTGMRRGALEKALSREHLSLGGALPDGGLPTDVVVGQLPSADQRVDRGTPVTVFMSRPAMAGPPPAIPPPAGRRALRYTRALSEAGLVPKVIRAVDPRPAGTVVETIPPAGTRLRPGSVVTVVIGAGVPWLAFDTGSAVNLLDPLAGRTVRRARPIRGEAIEPSWSGYGTQVLYRTGNRLSLVSPGDSGRGRVLYGGKPKLTTATLAPAPGNDVVAFVRRTKGGDGDLCFGRVTPRTLDGPRCMRDNGWDLGRKISWRRDGRALMVFGSRREDPRRFGMLRFTTAKPFSTSPADWRGRLVTDASTPGRGVIAAAWSPFGKRVALVSNVATPRFQLVVTDAAVVFSPRTEPLPVRACEVAWRPDGAEVAVVQSDDACASAFGDVVRVDLERPRNAVTVATGGRHPAYQPLAYGGATTAP